MTTRETVRDIVVEESNVALRPTGGSCWHIYVSGWTGAIGSITVSREDSGVARLTVKLRQIVRDLKLGRALHRLCRQLQTADPAIETFVAGPVHVLREGPIVRAFKSGGFRYSSLSEDQRFWEGRLIVRDQEDSLTWEQRRFNTHRERTGMGSC